MKPPARNNLDRMVRFCDAGPFGWSGLSGLETALTALRRIY